MSYPAISLATATVGRYRCPQKRLQTARQPPVYPNSSPRIIAPVTPSPPSAALTPSIPVHRWIRAKEAAKYGSIKGRIAREFPGDRQRYMEEKSPYVENLEQRALAWSSEQEAIPDVGQ